MISHFRTRHAFKCGGTQVIMMIRFYKKYTVEPLYKGQVGLSLIQWSLSTRDKLGTGPVPYTVEPLYKGQVGDGSFVTYTVEPLYKGHVGDGSLVPYTVEPLYKRQVGDGSFVTYTVEPLYKGQVGDRMHCN